MKIETDPLGGAMPAATSPAQSHSERGGCERRLQPRRRVMWRALADGAPCGVRDLSEGGARVLLSSTPASDVPIILSVRHRQADYPAAIVWRQGSAAGLRFLGQERMS